MTDLTGRTRRRRAATPTPGDRTLACAATTPFAPTSYARLRLLRQMHACGLLSGPQARTPDPARRELADGSATASC